MKILKQLLCSHEFNAPSLTGASKLRMTEPWSSETGYEVRNQYCSTCSLCGKTNKFWKMTQKRQYGTIVVEKFIDKTLETNKLVIWEGVESTWHYHLSTGGRENVLCGNTHVMPTGLPLNIWGFKSEHLHETYCKECEKIAFSNKTTGGNK